MLFRSYFGSGCAISTRMLTRTISADANSTRLIRKMCLLRDEYEVAQALCGCARPGDITPELLARQ